MLTADYLVGLVDGEGSFSAALRKPKKSTWHTRIECYFAIKMREDDLALLKKIRKFFSCGSIFFQKEYRANQRDNYRYQVSNKSELAEIIIPFFRNHRLQSKRAKDFHLFCNIVDLALRKEHHTVKGLAHIRRLKEKMHA